MALPPVPIQPNNPIPNPPFNTTATTFLKGPFYNSNILPGSGLTISPTGQIIVTGGGGGGTVSSVTGTAPILVANGTTTPVISVSAATTAAPGVVQLSDSVNSGSSATAATSAAVQNAYTLAQTAAAASTNALQTTGGTMTGPIVFAAGQTVPITALPPASTTQVGLVQLNDTLTSTSTTEALTANQGRILAQQISSLTVASNITLAGTFDANQSKMLTVTTEGGALPPGSEFVLGADLPAPDANNNNYFVIATVPGTYNPPGGGGPYNVVDGDWLLSDGVVYEFLAVGFTAPYASTASSGVVQLATNLQTQTGTDGTVAVTPASLQSKISDSTAVSSSTTIASSTAVKSAYDIAVAAQTAGTNAVPKSLYALKGDILGGTAIAGTPQALALGTAGQVLTVSAASPTGLAWTTPAATGVTNVATGTGLTGGPITTTGTISLANTAVTCGSYTYASITVDCQGRLTAASNGAAPNTIACLPLTNAGTAVAPILCITAATTSDCGAVRLATVSETQTGTSAALGVTPQGVACTYIACAQLANKGSLLTRNATNVVALPTGGAANNGKVLTINDSCAEGLEWKATAVSGGTVTSVGAGTGLCTSIALNAPITTSGTLALTNTGVTAGTYPYAALTVDAQGRLSFAVSCAAPNTTVTAPITNSGTAVAPVIGISCATTAALGAVQVGTNIDVAAGVISVKSATTAQAGVVQLNDTTSNTSTTLALTAAQGKNLQDQINNLSVTSNLTLAGTINGSDGKMLTVTTAAAALSTPFAQGADMPPAAPENAEFFAIVTTPGTMTPPGGVAQAVNDGDWWVSSGVPASGYTYYAVGFSAPYASETASGVVELATNAETLTGTDNTRVIVPSALQAKMSDATNVTCSQQIASSTAVKAAFDQANTKIACSLLTTTGDLIYASAASTPARLPIGTNGQVLTISGGIPSWGSPAGTPVATCSSSGTVLGCTFGSNTTLGCLAGSGSASGNTVAIGFQAGCAIAGAFSNTLIGWNAATSLTCGNNTAIGVCALKSATTGTFNIAIGENSGGTLTTGGCNILLGNFASLNTTGTANLILGNNACANGNCNVAIGPNIQLAAGNGQLAIGYDSNKCWLTGNSTNAIKPAAGIIDCANSCGTAGQVLMSNGLNAVCWGAPSGGPAATPSVAGVVLGCTMTVLRNTALGCEALLGITSGNNLVAIGSNALRCATTASANVAIGCGTLAVTTFSNNNTAVGNQAGNIISSGNSNTLIGSAAGDQITTGTGNTVVAASNGNITTGSNNLVLGYGARVPLNTGSCQLAIGWSTFDNWLTGNCFKAIKPGAGIIDCANLCGTDGQVLISRGNAIQWGTSGSPATPTTLGLLCGCSTTHVVALGCQALANGSGGLSNVAIGFNTLFCLTNGTSNTVVGSNAAQLSNAQGNSLLGAAAACSLTTGGGNSGVGLQVFRLLTTGASNVAVGQFGLCGLTSGSGNVALGCGTGRTITTGCQNLVLGCDAQVACGTLNCQLALGFGPNANENWLTGNSTRAIRPGAGIIDCAGCCGTDGQVLLSRGNSIQWGAATAAAATRTTLGTVFGCTGSSGTWLQNTAIGCEALNCLTTGIGNIALSPFALSKLTTGNNNIAIGINSGINFTTADCNVAIGPQGMLNNVTGSCNVSIGVSALNGLNGGEGNVGIGLFAGARANLLSCDNVYIGRKSGECGSNAKCFNVAVGSYALMCNTGGNGNITIGCGAGCNITSGNNNVAIGFNAQVAGPAGNCQLAIGFSATDNWLTGNSFKAIRPGAGIIDCAGSCGTAGQVLMSNGLNAVCWGTAGGGSAATPLVAGVVLGCTAGTNAGLGACALKGLTSGNGNTAVGVEALCTVSSGTGNTAVGNQALLCATTGGFNTAVGLGSLSAVTIGTQNVGVGFGVSPFLTSGSNNVVIGTNSGYNNATASNNVSIGLCALFCNTAGLANTAVGSQALRSTTGQYNTGLGCAAGCAITVGNNNVAIGYFAQVASPTLSCQLAIGFENGQNWLTGDSTKAIRPGAGILDCAGCCGTNGQILFSRGNAIQWGANPAGPATPYTRGVVLGCTDNTNAGIGCCTLACLTSGANNSAIGRNSLKALTSGFANTALGDSAFTAITAAACNTGVGANAGASTNSGTDNVFVGYNSGFSNTSGGFNTAIGTRAGQNLSTGSCNVVIGYCAQVQGSLSCQLAIGWGPNLNENWLIGCSNRSIRPGGAILDCSSNPGTIGQYLWTTVNGIVWASSSPSDIRDKEVIGNLGTALPVVNQIQPIVYLWKPRGSEIACSETIYGFSAQQLQEVDPNLTDSQDEQHLRIHDRKILPLLVKAIQELSAENKELRDRLDAAGL